MGKLTAKKERFALAWFETGNKTKAYKSAYSTENQSEKTINEAASRLSKDDKVLARFKELQAELSSKTMIKQEDVSKMLEQAFEAAKTAGLPAAMVSAASAMAKLHGLNEPDKKEVTTEIKERRVMILPDNGRD